jgi:hypothetical protein
MMHTLVVTPPSVIDQIQPVSTVHSIMSEELLTYEAVARATGAPSRATVL